MRAFAKKRWKWALGWLLVLGMPTVVIVASAGVTNLSVLYWGRFGYSNSTDTGSVAVGNGHSFESPATGTLTVGQSLVARDSNCLVVGTWNKATDAAAHSREERFIIGNGSGYNDQRNCVEFFSDGKLRIPQVQGDLDLGEYGFE
ncbi:MAG: hypothetical protein AAF394_16070 [Planctomycetota bacterium]